jgi:uncharacterized protein
LAEHAEPSLEASEASIPAIPQEPPERRLDPRVIHLWRLGILVRTVILAPIVVFLGRAAALELPWMAIGAGVVVLGVVLAVAWPPARYRAWAFRMRAADLAVRYGVLWKTASVFPYSRIQHVDTQHGPLERSLGLARLIVYTAGVRGADLVIPGLAAGEAEALREQLAALGGGEDAL